ncbi:MAG: radical SAM protein [Armatimonadetes bacterium]|nr:radical SAM protein [Armatimonadota bacterium]
MNAEQKLEILAADYDFDRVGSPEGVPSTRQTGSPACEGIGGGPGDSSPQKADHSPRLFKVLQSNECVHSCAFCPWRSGRDTSRATFEPEELATLFHRSHAAGYADGLYLTSGVRESGPVGMDAMLQTADLLRKRHEYGGYLHLKVLPGAERAQVQEAMRLADRVSINLETPTEAHHSALTTGKRLETDLMERLRWVRDLSSEFPLGSGVTTQFVVGAAGETDRDLLTRARELYQDFGLRRVHFSAFKPVIQTPLEARPPTPDAREARLQQADLLLRGYEMNLSEMAFTEGGYLSLHVDPKMAQALNHPERFPVEVNTAPYEELIRVPGIGPLSAKRLIGRRRERLIRDPREVALCGAILKRAAPFLLLDGRAVGHLEQFIRQELRRLNTRPAYQLPLFGEGD